MIAAIFDGGRREAICFTALAALLVLLRSALFLLHGYVDFNSDQAIVGLMAKHLSEFRTFPLFFYGQNYMLGAQAWFIAPVFWIVRPSIAALKAPLVLLNIAAAVMLMRGVSSRVQIRPALGFVAALPFIMPTPVIAGSYLQTLGSSGVEPLLYVLILWMLRGRPFAFGALLVFGFLHREFTIYAVPAMFLAHVTDRATWTPAAARWAGWMAAGAVLLWLVLDDVRLHLEGASLFLQAQMAGQWACFDLMGPIDRIRFLITTCLPVLIGGTTMPLDHYAMRSAAVAGYPAIGWLVGGSLALMLGRLAWLALTTTHRSSSIRFAVYLTLVGCATFAGYGLTCSFAYPVFRYFNLGILAPIGCFAAFVAWEPSVWLRRAAVAIFIVWGAVNAVDNVRALRAAYANPQADPHGELTNYLVGHQIRYARADYWDAYVVDFLSRERVIVASIGPVRIPEYQQRVDEHRDAAVDIQRQPCDGRLQVAGWCVHIPIMRRELGTQ